MKKPLRLAVLAAIVLTLALAGRAFAHEAMEHMAMTPTENLPVAADPAYPPDTGLILLHDHMPGMKGAAARVSGAFDTVLYAIDYTRSDTGEKVENHRWVIHEEIQGNSEKPYVVGDKVTLLPGHISSMGGEGVLAEISEVLPGVAYMVDFLPTDGSEPVLNHQWMSEDELLLCVPPSPHTSH